MGYLEFDTEIEAIEAERNIALDMGLPKYGLRQDGTTNSKVIIDKWDIPTLNDNGKWVIKEPTDET